MGEALLIRTERRVPIDLERSRLAFFFLAVYLISQMFLIPLAAIGPIWALWPTLPDLALGGLAAAALLGSRSRIASSRAQQSLLRSLLLVATLCFASYLLMLFVFEPPASGKALPIIDGAHNIFRLMQFIILYAVVIQIPLNEGRLGVLGWAADAAFLAVCAGVFLTYFEVIPLRALVAHLPQNPRISGNWYQYVYLDRYADVAKGLGTISYSHAYTSLQILMLLALRLHLLGPRRSLHAAAYVLLAVGAAALTESRAGLAAVLLFASVYSLGNPKILIGGALLAVLTLPFIDWRRLESTLRRQRTIVEATEGDNLSGRRNIWSLHMSSFAETPWRLLIGGGFGSARSNGRGSTAHMLYLQILSECGIMGLLLFASLTGLILRSLYRNDVKQKPLFWAAVAFLMSALTQETFYPLPSQGHFLGLFLAAIGISLRSAVDRTAKPHAPAAQCRLGFAVNSYTSAQEVYGQAR